MSLTLLTAVCRLARTQEVCPLAHLPLPESSCCVCLWGGGKCRVPCASSLWIQCSRYHLTETYLPVHWINLKACALVYVTEIVWLRLIDLYLLLVPELQQTSCTPLLLSVDGTDRQTDTVHTHSRLTALFPGLPGWADTRKVTTNLDFCEARDSEWQWHQLGCMQVCTLLQTDNHASTPLLSFFTGRTPFLLPNQQRQSTEGTERTLYCNNNNNDRVYIAL